MQQLARRERLVSELDTIEYPKSLNNLHWSDFNTDMYSTERSHKEIDETLDSNMNEHIDLRPYMIESPYVCTTTDRI